MKLKTIYNFLKLDTFSGTVIKTGTTNLRHLNDPHLEIVSLDITIRSDSDPEAHFIYHMGILEFMHSIKEHSVAVGDHITIRKYPLQTIYGVKRFESKAKMSANEKLAVNWLVDHGIKELQRKSKLLRMRSGGDDITAMQLETHALRAILIKSRLMERKNEPTAC